MPKQPFVPVSNVIRVKFSGTNQGTPWVNLFAVIYSGQAPNNNDMSIFATALRGNWVTNFGPFVHTQVSLLTTQVWDITSSTGATGLNTTAATGTGPAGTPLPTNCAFTVSWPVQSRWRGGHFRTYIPGRNTADTTNGHIITTAAITALQSAAAAFQTAVNGEAVGTATCKLGGVRYFPTGVGVVRTSGTPFQFGTPIVHTRLDTQRRRLGKEVI